jgi:hypothetical protein
MEGEFYLQARREWDERYGDLVLGKRNWQITSAGLMLLSLILALGIVSMSARTNPIRSRSRQARLRDHNSNRSQRLENIRHGRADEALRDRRLHPQCAFGLQRSACGTEHAQRHARSMRTARRTSSSIRTSMPMTSRRTHSKL